MPEIASLHCYPVKSCAGIALREAELDAYGIRYDRAFMLVQPDGTFVTQRQDPRLAQLRPRFDGNTLVLGFGDADPLSVALDPKDGTRREVRVWRHTGPALDLGEAAAIWLERHFRRPWRLVRIPPEHRRRVNPERFPGEAHTAFSDGYPLLALSQASLDDLNERLAEPVPMDRFRPNIVIAGCQPYAEDTWQRVRINAIELAGVKDCPRCGVPSVDQRTGELTGKDPLRTLARYRRRDGEAVFGRNWVQLARGTLRVGDPVEVLAEAPALPFDEIG